MIVWSAALVAVGGALSVGATVWLATGLSPTKPGYGTAGLRNRGLRNMLREGHLRALDVDTVVVCGCNFPNCPRATIYEASERDFNIVFVRDGTSGVYARGMDELKRIGVDVQDVDDCAARLQQTPIGGNMS